MFNLQPLKRVYYKSQLVTLAAEKFVLEISQKKQAIKDYGEILGSGKYEIWELSDIIESVEQYNKDISKLEKHLDMLEKEGLLFAKVF